MVPRARPTSGRPEQVEALLRAAARYPRKLVPWEEFLVRVGEYPDRLERTYVPGGRVVELGGGLACTSVALAYLGMDVHVVDNFSRPYYALLPWQRARRLVEEAGVHIHQADILESDLAFVADGSVDRIVTFDCLEHLHHSPKAILERCVEKLATGGRLLVGVPNAVNLMKRMRVLAGRSNLEPAHAFYHHGQPFTGHVREWTAGELLQLARWLGLSEARVIGRNWLGYRKYERVPVVAKFAIDQLLRPLPTLCSDLLLEAVKR
ncbi:MAG TPA: class I SAM-dependent methyltransferase [Kofleriaceae bacterium]|nr:class I SAM-dependent methyltransferase [Kofleriaceae bacterium]